MELRYRFLREVLVPAQTGRGVLLRKDQCLKVSNVQGRQVGDLFAFVMTDPEEQLSPKHTLRALGRIYPQVGKPLYSNRRRPLLLLEEDTVSVHDLLLPSCDSTLYEQLGVSGHPNCHDNLAAALEELSVTPPRSLPDPVNLFQNTPVIDLDGRWEVRESPAQPGDYVLLRALDDLLVVLTACAMDLSPLNGGNPTDLLMELFE
jgi:uncharacterized protein YcgI (DUF1989 family)